jgi:hypothetical protein
MLVIRTGRKGLNVPYWEFGNWKTCEVQLRQEYGACLEQTGILRLFIGDRNMAPVYRRQEYGACL